MQRFRLEDFVNGDGRRVLDEAGRQGIDGITRLGSSTEVRCGLILQALAEHAHIWPISSSMTSWGGSPDT